MVRHSGFFTSFAAVLLAALSVSILERRTDGSSQISGAARDNTALKAGGDERSHRQTSASVMNLTAPATSHPDLTIRIPVPANALLIVGSLDVSGAAHSLVINSQPGRSPATDTFSCPNQLVDLEYIDRASRRDFPRMLQQASGYSSEHDASATSETPHTTCGVHALNNEPTRRFLIPHFEHDQVAQHPSEASPLAKGSRVIVYADLSVICSSSDIAKHREMCDTALRVCEAIEYELLPLIENWVGNVTDLDGDQLLSVVLTELDRRRSPDENPVLGCVRRSDFSANDQNSLAGDILYLDHRLPPKEQLRALLAHELTHAAIFCIRHEAPHGSPLKEHSIPSWLNEAAAHWVERQFCSNPAGYAAREAAFHQSPAQCPIIIRDDNHYLSARRAGSRVAGFTFLQQHLTDVDDLRALLKQHTPFEQSISAITMAPFSELFREWTINQAGRDSSRSPTMNPAIRDGGQQTTRGPVRRKLHGTAFMMLQSETEQVVSIQAESRARLQITVLHQPNALSLQRVSKPERSPEERDVVKQISEQQGCLSRL